MSHPYSPVSLVTQRERRPARTAAAALSALLLLGSATASLAPVAAVASPPDGSATTARAVVPALAGPYLSVPPSLPGTTSAPAEPAPQVAETSPSPTRGRVTGRVLAPDGKPLAGALVEGVRFSDLGPGIDTSSESPVLTRTGADGRFRLPQLRERYLVRVCDAAPGALQCGGDKAPDRYAPTYAGPDGVRSSWVTHTRMFTPKNPTRAVGTITMRR